MKETINNFGIAYIIQYKTCKISFVVKQNIKHQLNLTAVHVDYVISNLSQCSAVRWQWLVIRVLKDERTDRHDRRQL